MTGPINTPALHFIANMNVSVNITSTTIQEEEDIYSKLFDYIQFCATTIGFVANVLTLITLSKHGKSYAKIFLNEGD